MAQAMLAQLVGVDTTLLLQKDNVSVTKFRESERALSHFKFKHQDRLAVHKQTIDHMSSDEAKAFSEGLVRALDAKPWRWKYAKQQHKSYWARVAAVADYARSKSFLKRGVPAAKDNVLAG